MEIFYYIFLYFLIYSMLGWLCEVIYCAIWDKKLTNRGFLHGPYCPIYGCGAMIIVYVLIKFRSNIVLVFLLGMLFTSALEYITSYVMEKIFNARWWDYSNNFMNINGRVCIVNSILFGILSIVTLYIIHPIVVDLITKIPVNIVPIISLLLIILFTVDIVITITTMLNLKQKVKKLKDLKEELDIKLQEITKPDLVPVVAEILQMQIRDLIAEKRYFERRLLNAFPHMKFSKFSSQFKELKEAIDKSEQIRKEKINKIKNKISKNGAS